MNTTRLAEDDTEFLVDSMSNDELEEALPLFYKAFGHLMTPPSLARYLDHALDPLTSLKAVVDGKIVGAYVTAPCDMVHLLRTNYSKGDVKILSPLKPYEHKEGLEGIALAVDSKFKGKGIGKALIQRTMDNMEFDYVFGLQDDDLKNLQDWTKRRVHIADIYGGRVHVTATKPR